MTTGPIRVRITVDVTAYASTIREIRHADGQSDDG